MDGPPGVACMDTRHPRRLLPPEQVLMRFSIIYDRPSTKSCLPPLLLFRVIAAGSNGSFFLGLAALDNERIHIGERGELRLLRTVGPSSVGDGRPIHRAPLPAVSVCEAGSRRLTLLGVRDHRRCRPENHAYRASPGG